jgi:hypothetical protein
MFSAWRTDVNVLIYDTGGHLVQLMEWIHGFMDS